MKLYSIGEFAQRIGRTEQTLRNWDKSAKFKPHHDSVGKELFENDPGKESEH